MGHHAGPRGIRKGWYLYNLARLFVFAAIVCALLDLDWKLVLGLFAVGVIAWLVSGRITQSKLDADYEELVQRHRLKHEAREPLFNYFAGGFTLAFLGSFIAFAVFSIIVNHFWPMLVWFVLALGAGLLIQRMHDQRLQQLWANFAKESGLKFTPGRMWNLSESPRLEGEVAGRAINISYSWSSRLHSNRKQTLFARTWVNESVSGDFDFYLHHGKTLTDPLQVAAELLKQEQLNAGIHFLARGSVSLTNGQIEFVIDRSPSRAMELRYYVAALLRIASEVESIVEARKAAQAEQLKSI